MVASKGVKMTDEEYKKFIEIGREMLELQGSSGNWDYDPYMHGMYNGMEFTQSLFEGREPVFRDAPKKWKERSKLSQLLWKVKVWINPSHGLSKSVDQGASE